MCTHESSSQFLDNQPEIDCNLYSYHSNLRIKGDFCIRFIFTIHLNLVLAITGNAQAENLVSKIKHTFVRCWYMHYK